jgi:type II secretory pathway component HofQ
MVTDRTNRLTKAGWERKGSFFMAGPAVVQGSDLETLTDTQFTDKLNEGIEHLAAIARARAEQEQREAEAEALRIQNEEKDREIEALRKQLAALQQPVMETTAEPTAPAPAPPPPFPNRRQVVAAAPTPPPAPVAPAEPPAPAPFPKGGAKEAVIDQSYVNGFFKCREQAVHVIMARSEEDGAYLYLKRSDMVDAIKSLMPKGE